MTVIIEKTLHGMKGWYDWVHIIYTISILIIPVCDQKVINSGKYIIL